jgi:hypothetical protein
MSLSESSVEHVNAIFIELGRTAEHLVHRRVLRDAGLSQRQRPTATAPH